MAKQNKSRKQRDYSPLKALLADPRVDTKQKQKRPRKKMSPLNKLIIVIMLIVIVAVVAFVARSFGTAARAYQSGMEAYEAGNYTEAVTNFTSAVNSDGSNKEYQIHLGLAQVRSGQVDEAVTTFQTLEADTRGDEHRQALRGLGIAYIYRGNYGEAVTTLTEALQGASSRYSDLDLDIAYYLADAQNRNDDPVGAVLTYTEIIKQQPDANAYMLRGMAYQAVGDNSSAEADLKQALSMSTQGYKVYMALYQVLLAQGKTDDATKLLEEATSLGTKSAEDYSNRGLIYMYLGQYDQAESDINQAIDQGYTAGYFAKAQLMMARGAYAEAINNFNTYFENHSDNALAYNEFGVCLMNMSRYAEAADMFSRGLALNDMMVNQEIMFNEVVAYERAGDWATALTKITAYMQKYADDAAGQKELEFIQSRQN